MGREAPGQTAGCRVPGPGSRAQVRCSLCHWRETCPRHRPKLWLPARVLRQLSCNGSSHWKAQAPWSLGFATNHLCPWVFPRFSPLQRGCGSREEPWHLPGRGVVQQREGARAETPRRHGAHNTGRQPVVEAGPRECVVGLYLASSRWLKPHRSFPEQAGFGGRELLPRLCQQFGYPARSLLDIRAHLPTVLKGKHRFPSVCLPGTSMQPYRRPCSRAIAFAR